MCCCNFQAHLLETCSFPTTALSLDDTRPLFSPVQSNHCYYTMGRLKQSAAVASDYHWLLLCHRVKAFLSYHLLSQGRRRAIKWGDALQHFLASVMPFCLRAKSNFQLVMRPCRRWLRLCKPICDVSSHLPLSYAVSCCACWFALRSGQSSSETSTDSSVSRVSQYRGVTYS